jgi:hypothetical protein
MKGMSKTVLVVGSIASAMVLACMAAVLTATPGASQTQTVTLVGAGDIAECSPDNNAEETAALLAKIPGTVLALGDNAYPDGTRTQYANCYDNYRLSDGSVFDARTSWWGQYKARTMPVVGNHEYHISKVAQPYFDYFSAINGFKQPRAPVPNTSANPGLTPRKGYYSYDRGSWHIVALNSNCNKVGGCEKTSAQGKWLRNDLANTTNKRCTLAYFHHPLYSTGNNIPNPNVKPLWQILYNNHAEVIVNGHAHRYERFVPITPAGTTDPQHGIRQFVAGTGGAPGGSEVYPDQAPGVEKVETGTPGVLKLDLSAGSYSWRFVPIAGQSFTDSGTGSCH